MCVLKTLNTFAKKEGKILVLPLPVFCIFFLYYYSLIQNNKNGEFVNAGFKLSFLLNRDISIRHHQHHKDHIKEEEKILFHMAYFNILFSL